MKLKIREIKNTSGFTLVEMIVSTAVIALLSTVFLANYHSYGVKGNLNMAAQKLASDIREVQGYALGLKEFEGASPPATPLGGWGIRLNQGSGEYILFADRDESKKYLQSEDSSTLDNEFYQKIKFDKNVIVRQFNIGGNSNRPYLYIVYTPPDPVVHIGAAQNENNDNLLHEDSQEAEIVLEANNSQIILKVNAFGLVDAKN